MFRRRNLRDKLVGVECLVESGMRSLRKTWVMVGSPVQKDVTYMDGWSLSHNSGDYCYHVISRANARLPIFFKEVYMSLFDCLEIQKG